MPLPAPVSLTPCLPQELLSYILEQTSPAVVIICQPRTEFLSSLLKNLLALETRHEGRQSVQFNPDSDSEWTNNPDEFPLKTADEDVTDQPRHEQTLLIPTLEQISRSRQTNMAYVRTVSHLRAYLSVLPCFPPTLGLSVDNQASSPDQAPLLLIYGLVELHRETSEWSTQGLGITLASVVDAGLRAGRRVVAVEEWVPEPEPPEHRLQDGDEPMDDNQSLRDEGGGIQVERLKKGGTWHDRLPILSGSVRRAGTDSEFGGRIVEVGVVMSRWFSFRRGTWDDGGRI